MRYLATLLVAAASLGAQNFVNYESPQTHGIALSADGKRLFVVNTPDNRLGVYSTEATGQPVLLHEVFVGLEPVSVRPRTAAEVWVTCHLSDCVSVVDVVKGVVTATIRVGDEPADVAFAEGMAFVSVAGADELRVFDPLTHQPLGVIPIFGDEPRTLLASADGKTLWAVVHRSGNDTTILPHTLAPAQPRPTNPKLKSAPRTGLIIDSEDPTWTGKHSVVLPDYDLIEIDAKTLSIRKRHQAVGTIHTGAAQRPGTDEVWVANTEARNLVRFVTNLRGHAWDNRVTRVRTGTSTVTPFDLNPSINYATLPNNAALSSALAQPQDLVWDAAGKTMYVAAFGTDRIGILDASGAVTGFIEVGNTPGAKTDPRHKRGPRGLALHASGLLYVLNRLSNTIVGIDTATQQVLWEVEMFDPTPTRLKEGRGFLYDAKLSGNGTFSCASCHVDGDTDGLAWDLGDPGGEMFNTQTGPAKIALHPMKGPMLTQTLKGLKGTAPFHWRGDKPTLQDFNGTFDELMGRSRLASADMDDLVAFMESIRFPPNPNRTLDDALASQDARDGEHLFENVPFNSQGTRCVSCHFIPTGTNQLIIPNNLLQQPQAMKTAQLRNIYKRFGLQQTPQGRKSGFGLTHDGELEDMIDFLSLPVFGSFSNNATTKRRIQAFILAFPTESAPTTGYQVSVDPTNVTNTTVLAAVQKLQFRAAVGDIELVLKGKVDGQDRGMLYDAFAQHFLPDSSAATALTWSQVAALIQSGRASFTATGVAPGTGRRTAIDRDGDGTLDRDEGVLSYGAGTAGCVGVPSLRAGSSPRLGNAAFALVGAGAGSRVPGYFALGRAAARLPLLGITILVDLTAPVSVVLPVVSATDGTLNLPVPLPSDPRLVGITTFSQVAWVDSCGPRGLSATPGLQLTIQK